MHRGVRTAARLLSGAMVCAASLVAPYAADPAYAAPRCTTNASSAPATSDAATVPWPVAASGVADLAKVADGHGETVAVIDSGVTPVSSLGSRVLRGLDLLGTSDGRLDCVGHGTAVASIIAAAPAAGVGFRGLAPAARILPIRATEAELVGQETSGKSATPAAIGRAITWAVDHDADVVNISLVSPDNATLRAAVKRALAHGVVVIASVGNGHEEPGPDPTPYPAAYPGVIGVGAIEANGERSSTSAVGDFLDVVAPGGDVVADKAPSGLATFAGTSFAVPYVAATAALVREEYPDLDAQAVAARIFATTDPPPVNADPAGYGHGIVDPYRAVAAALPATDAGTTTVGVGSPQPGGASLGTPGTVGLPAARHAGKVEQLSAAADPVDQRAAVAIAIAIAAVAIALAWAFGTARHRRLGG